jgi:pimeloyl-ACP methyl ester carboxylesterase
MRVYEPGDGNFADTETGIVLFNQFGSTVSQDSGRDAKVLADTFNLPVLAVDRPGTAGVIPSKKLADSLSTPNGYLVEMASLGKEIDKRAESLGMSKTIAAGRSAGGLGALALARTETVSSTRAVFAAEPVGCEKMALDQGVKRYSNYLKHQKELLDDKEMGLVRPQSPGLSLFPTIGRIISIPIAGLYDKFHNKSLFASDAALQYAAYIAENMNLIDVTMEFAEHSMVATPEAYNRDIVPISWLRVGGAPFVVRQPAGTVHASFDNRGYMNQVIEPTIKRTIKPPRPYSPRLSDEGAIS